MELIGGVSRHQCVRWSLFGRKESGVTHLPSVLTRLEGSDVSVREEVHENYALTIDRTHL